MNRERMPFGSWPSPISAKLVASSGSGHSALPSDLQADDTGIYWIEPRPDEGGRYVIQRRLPSGKVETCTPGGCSVNSRVHEYGGGSFLLHQGVIFFSNESDQRLYRQEPGGVPLPITPEPQAREQLRFANGCMHPSGHEMIYVCEKHTLDGSVENFLVRLAVDGSRDPVILEHAHDFYAHPRISPDGSQLMWITWDHPQMPWDGTDLWLADLNDQGLGEVTHLAGGPSESIYQPEWNSAGEIFFVSDRDGWWRLYQQAVDDFRPLTHPGMEIGEPLWTLGKRSYAFISLDKIIAAYKVEGKAGLAVIDILSGSTSSIESDINYIDPSITVAPDRSVWLLAGTSYNFPGLCRLFPESGEIIRIAEVRSYDLDLGYISRAEQYSFTSPGGGPGFAYFYPPTHPQYDGQAGEKPPLIVMGHGGPTSCARPYLNLEIQFWTSRGFSVADVDYSGSTGYGREYRDRLKGEWGIRDVADCVEAARHLGEIGLIDPDRLIITGGSAGGYIVLRILTEFDIFSCGASYYGVADIAALAHDTVKFESNYDVSLIGPYPMYAETYTRRSPIHFADQVRCPIILFQGMADKVVPPSQSEIFVDALRRKGLYYEYITFENEGHGFRDSANIESSMLSELAFYRKVLEI